MIHECSVVRDLLPLYAENMVSPDTEEYITRHLQGCDACRREYAHTREPRPAQEMAGAAPLRLLSRRMTVKRIQIVALTVVIMITLCVCAFAVLDAPEYFPYTEGLVTPTAQGDGGMLLTFDEAVTAFDYTVYDDPEGGDFYYCDIQAWTSLWDRWFSGSKRALSATVTLPQKKPVVMVYIPNDGRENIRIARYDSAATDPIETDIEYEGRVTLPRLSLGYYFLLAAGTLMLSAAVWLLLRRKAAVRVWIERIGLYPAAYMISHGIVTGVCWASYSLPRDFFLILFISLLLYGGLLLAHSIRRMRREIREVQG